MSTGSSTRVCSILNPRIRTRTERIMSRRVVSTPGQTTVLVSSPTTSGERNKVTVSHRGIRVSERTRKVSSPKT